ncbi:hypothetical protein [Calothrix sp. PCC 7507]|uniref:hypothetical protein n=1 Tax=Calothrix sp. PCC 7507 TaxID=99598 RepID=UPI00029F38AF|nr:hypothetical protein [Calothrix sp. PCC 7507]AFY31587.1 hypothetical protein Cal7507_1111 [Calothrix sp. PCC 7507]
MGLDIGKTLPQSPVPNPQSPVPSPQSPVPNPQLSVTVNYPMSSEIPSFQAN